MISAGRTRIGVVIVAAGSGQRFGAQDKVLYPIAGKPMIDYSIELFASIPEVERIVVVAGQHSMERIRERVAWSGVRNITVCRGGDTRRESVTAGFDQVRDAVDLVAVHDAARPLADRHMVQRVIDKAAQSGAAVPVVPVSDTIYRVEEDGRMIGIEPRDELRAAQTPQVARTRWLRVALAKTEPFTDEGSALLASGYEVATVSGCADNLKVTWPEDVRRAELILTLREGV